MNPTLRLAAGSIAVGLLVLSLKYVACTLTGSVALYSDALESTLNFATAIGAFMAVRISSAPPDSNHPYGHHKVEYLSAVVEGVLIVVACLSIVYAAYQGIARPKPIDAPPLGLLVNAGASAVNAGWCFLLAHYGRKWRSPALLADARHLWTDVVTSRGVLVGLGLVWLTDYLVLDPAVATLVAVNILWTGWRLMRESVGGLIDEAAPEATLKRVREIISSHAGGALEAHDLRTRHAGRATFIDFHLVVPGTMTVSESHGLCERIEAALKEEIPDVRSRFTSSLRRRPSTPAACRSSEARKGTDVAERPSRQGAADSLHAACLGDVRCSADAGSAETATRWR